MTDTALLGPDILARHIYNIYKHTNLGNQLKTCSFAFTASDENPGNNNALNRILRTTKLIIGGKT